MPLLTTLLVQTAGAAVMGQMMATVGLPMILGPLVGPVIGGIIIKFLSWHWIFLDQRTSDTDCTSAPCLEDAELSSTK